MPPRQRGSSRRAFREQLGVTVDQLVRRLRAEDNGRHEQLERRPAIELAVRVRCISRSFRDARRSSPPPSSPPPRGRDHLRSGRLPRRGLPGPTLSCTLMTFGFAREAWMALREEGSCVLESAARRRERLLTAGGVCRSGRPESACSSRGRDCRTRASSGRGHGWDVSECEGLVRAIHARPEASTRRTPSRVNRVGSGPR